MKRNILIVLVLLFVTVGVAYADSILPEGVEQFYDDCGQVCYVWPDGSGDCYPCVECELPTPPVYPTLLPTQEPTKEPTPPPTPYVPCSETTDWVLLSDVCFAPSEDGSILCVQFWAQYDLHTGEACPVTKETTYTIPAPKQKCNRGLGNGSENCDPGNSGGKPGAAGEDNE